MPERVTSVRLSLQAQQYIAGMREAGRETAATGSAAERLAGQREAFNLLGRSMLVAGGLMAAGVGMAVARFVEFDQAMSQVKAVTQESVENMDLLRDAALDAGGATVYTATEAANAIEELGKNGLSTAQILSGGLDAALALAAAGGLDVARAAEIAAITMKQFNLEGAQLPHVADLMAAGAGKAAGDVEDMAIALQQAGLVASQTGLSVEETTGTLAAFADNALLGSDAGTSLRTMLLRLTPTSGEAAREMERLGIDAYDAGGQFIGMSALAGQLRDRLGGLTDEQRNTSLSIIFGQDAIRGATLLYQQGADGIQDYIDRTNDAGYASSVAADRLDNLAGDLEKLGGAFDTALIQSGSGANDVLRTLVQTATFVVDGFGQLPEPVLAAGLALGGAAAAVTLTGGAAMIAIPKIAEYRVAMVALGVSGRSAALGVGLASAAMTAGVAAFALWASWQANIKATADELADSLDSATGAMTSYTRAIVAKKLADSDAFAAAREAGISQSELTDAVLAGGDALDQVYGKLTDNNTVATFFTGVGIRAGNATQTIRDLRTAIDQSAESFEDQAAANSDATSASEENAEALADLQGAAYDAQGAVDDLAEAIRGFGSATLSTREAEREFQSAIDELTESVAENGRTLDINTEQGRNNEDALDSIAEAATELAAARLEETGSHEAAAAAIAAGREQLILALAQFGITGQAAEDYADRLGLIPANVYTAAELSTAAADGTMDAFIKRWDGKRIRVYADGSVSFGAGAQRANADGNLYDYARAFANGGFASGIYRGGPAIHKFAEYETGWEAYISGKPGQERENTGYAIEALRRLGGLGDLRHALAAGQQPTINVQAAPQQFDAAAMGAAIARGIAGSGVVEIGDSSVEKLSTSIAHELAPRLRTQARTGYDGV